MYTAGLKTGSVESMLATNHLGIIRLISRKNLGENVAHKDALNLALDLERHAEIRFALMKLGLNFAKLAETEKMSRSSFTACSQGHFYSDRVQKSLSKALNVPATALFFERYDTEREPIRSSKNNLTP